MHGQFSSAVMGPPGLSLGVLLNSGSQPGPRQPLAPLEPFRVVFLAPVTFSAAGHFSPFSFSDNLFLHLRWHRSQSPSELMQPGADSVTISRAETSPVRYARRRCLCRKKRAAGTSIFPGLFI